MEPGETKEVALHREIREELEVAISIDEYLMTVDYDYPNFHLTMHCFLCTKTGGVFHLNNHNDARWVTSNELESLDWLPADDEIIQKLKQLPN